MKSILLSFASCLVFSTAFAQVGIGTSSPSTSAQLEVNSSTRGFLPPRVALTATNATSPISSPVAGLMVYNTATAGTAPNNVTPGFYYYDGSKWQRIINQQPDATVEFDKATPTTSGVVFTPDVQNSKDYIYVSAVDGSQWTSDGTNYYTYTPPASTPWVLSGGTNDAGSNKTSSIHRSGKVGVGGNTTPNATLDIRTSPTSTTDPGAGFLGLGTTTATAIAAGAGAVRYSNSSGGLLQYSNGSNWNTLSSTVTKTVVTGYFSGTYASLGPRTLSCTETSDVNNNFSSNVFTAPRTGLYLITANLLTSAKGWTAGEEFNISFSIGGTDKIISAFFAQASITTFGGPTISAVIAMTAGETASFRAFNSMSGYILYGENYNRFSITEL